MRPGEEVGKEEEPPSLVEATVQGASPKAKRSRAEDEEVETEKEKDEEPPPLNAVALKKTVKEAVLRDAEVLSK